MNVRQLTVLLAANVLAGHGIAARAADVTERERNLWPVQVEQAEPAARGLDAWTAAGPFLFAKPAANAEGDTARGFRPFWVELQRPNGDFRAAYVLYPVFSYRVDETTYHWSVFELVRRWDRRAAAAAPDSVFAQREEFEIFPLWFSRESGDPEQSYRALFPIYGTVKNKLTIERLSWTLFPLYLEHEKRGAVTTYTPWPFIRVTRGAAQGWGVWPLYIKEVRPGVSRSEFYLWPLGYNVTRQPHPDDPPDTPVRHDVGFLPFYARSTGPGYVSKDFGWPFFGYTDRTSPKRYHERRYFWPFLVQGRGEDRYVNRWAPFYTHSENKGVDKRWYLWPLWRHATWDERGLERQRSQLLFFLYWNEIQRPANRSDVAPAELTHVWPLMSSWDNGAGRRQWQFPSPLEVFFPGNEKIRHAWSPLFSLARFDQRAPGDERTSLLWDAVTYERQRGGERSEFHLGPLLSVARSPEGQRVAIGNGLLGFRRSAGEGWRLFWLDFPPKPASTSPASR